MLRLVRAALAVALLVSAASVAASASGVALDGSVRLLTRRTFDAAADASPLLVSVSAEWCGHCARLKPVWASLAPLLAKQGVLVATVDGPSERSLSARLSVAGYPSIFFIKDGEVREYDGARAAPALLAWVSTGYKDKAPIPWHKSPLGPAGRARGAVAMLPDAAAAAWEASKAFFGVGDATMALLCAFALLVSVALFVVAIDYVLVWNAQPAAAAPRAGAAAAVPGPHQD